MTDNYFDPNSRNASPERRQAPELISNRVTQVDIATRLLIASTRGLTRMVNQLIEDKTPQLRPGTFEPKFTPIAPETTSPTAEYVPPVSRARDHLPTGFKPASNVIEMVPSSEQSPEKASYPMSEEEIRQLNARRAVEEARGQGPTPTIQSFPTAESQPPNNDYRAA